MEVHMSSDQKILARLSNVSKSYGSVVALRNISLELRAGEVLGVLGPNGAGKTTALGILMGQLLASDGKAELIGRDPRDIQARQRLGVMLQDGGLPDTLSIRELIKMFSLYYPNPRPLQEVVSLSGLEEVIDRRYAALSGGQKRRVQFALAICGRPDVLFVDEPTTGLDTEARQSFWAVMRRLNSEGVAMILTTHYLEEADALSDRIALINKGELILQDTPMGLKSRMGYKRIQCRTVIDSKEIEQWPDVISVEVQNNNLNITVSNTEAVLAKLLAADPQLSGLEVQSPKLEEAVMNLFKEAA
jgi:ABC-2 type transport system ATP-binding protein